MPPPVIARPLFLPLIHPACHPRMKSIHTLLLMAGLLCGQASSHGAAPGPGSTASLSFTIEQHPGKADWISCTLDAAGAFSVQGTLHAMRGQLPAQESHRILQEFDSLCVAAGADRFPRLPHIGGGQRPRPWFLYQSPQGRQLQQQGPRTPPPPALAEFMRTLWQKLFHHTAAHPIPSTDPAPASRAGPPPGFVRPLTPARPALKWR